MGDVETPIEEPIEEPITKKDPRRVEQGKRLAAISREAKEKKMRERIQHEMESKKSNYNYFWYGFGGISLLGFLYLITRKNEEVKYIYVPERKKQDEKEPKRNKEENFEVFD